MVIQDNSVVADKVQVAIRRLQSFCPQEGYYVAFSGGKDSQCVYHLCQMAGVKFDAHYSVTTVDPPELIRFIQQYYPDAWENRVRSEETMWSLIVKRRMPPTRLVRYCCQELKEADGEGRVTVTGVRWYESTRRRANQGAVTIMSKSKRLIKKIDETGVEYRVNKGGGIILNDDNDEARRAVEHCYRTHKTLVNPIIDWDDDDVWDFLNDVARVPHCCLYDQGMERLGCIGCPMARRERRKKEFERWPKYKKMYMRAFEHMLKARRKAGLETTWQTAEEVYDWWMEM